jgi:hypothetical protein|tara:strand:+ start:303 stop:923 length:621 start_codon:yes stop_codon:yes gene_type:complete
MTQKTKETTFEMLSKINVNKFVEKKNGLTYLSWAYAWSEVKSNCPDATYEIGETEYDESLGFMCHTSVTIDGETLPMWLPVMDGANKSMKKQAYKFTTRYGDKDVAAATTFDINKTIMRCLVKNLAMFGLGIYIFAGDDIPTSEMQEEEVKPKQLVQLKKGDSNWTKVSAFIKSNKAKGLDALLEQLKTKYTVGTATKTEIQKLLK